jgi:DNA invertase Pin-like site-specific DNA recombinase
VPPVVKSRAVAYYRQSAQDQQEDSIPIQRERIREWADDHDAEIVREFTDGQSPPDDSQDE